MMAKLLLPIRMVYIFFFWTIRGWRLEGSIPTSDKLVIIGAPHTSMWDYAHFLAGSSWIGRLPFVTIKKELFKPPLGWVLKILHGVSIDRKGSHGLVDQIVERIHKEQRIMMAFTPEATRSYRDHWKTGFYHVAVKANVPIVVAAFNYKDKRVYFREEFYPTGDMEADFEMLRAWYAEHGHGLYPDQTNDVRIRSTIHKEKEETFIA